ERIRIGVRVDEETSAPDFLLADRMIDGQHWAGHDVLIIDIGRNAHDAAWLRAHINELDHGISPKDMPVDGVLIREHALREALTHDDDRLAAFSIGIIEIATSDDGDAERG